MRKIEKLMIYQFQTHSRSSFQMKTINIDKNLILKINWRPFQKLFICEMSRKLRRHIKRKLMDVF